MFHNNTWTLEHIKNEPSWILCRLPISCMQYWDWFYLFYPKTFSSQSIDYGRNSFRSFRLQNGLFCYFCISLASLRSRDSNQSILLVPGLLLGPSTLSTSLAPPHVYFHFEREASFNLSVSHSVPIFFSEFHFYSISSNYQEHQAYLCLFQPRPFHYTRRPSKYPGLA